jgi:hypothetical protein
MYAFAEVENHLHSDGALHSMAKLESMHGWMDQVSFASLQACLSFSSGRFGFNSIYLCSLYDSLKNLRHLRMRRMPLSASSSAHL